MGAQYTREQIEETLRGKGYKYFTSEKGYDVNIIGIRNSETHGKVTNKFDDTLTISYKDFNGNWIYNEYVSTTDPDSHWEKNLLNKDGVAILNQLSIEVLMNLDFIKVSMTLRQKSPVKVYRDNNKDGDYDLIEENIDEGIFGINIHKPGSRVEGSTQIDKWSWKGCQVFSKESDFNEFMDICRKKWYLG